MLKLKQFGAWVFVLACGAVLPQFSHAAKSTVTFRELGFQAPLNIRGINGQIGVPFSVRADEVVTRAELNLIYNYSPSMLEELSHFNVIVNGEVVRSIPLPKSEAGKTNLITVDIPARNFTQFNRLGLELIGHYTLGCEDPSHSSLWLNVSNQSQLVLEAVEVPLANDLGSLPAPFFDSRDQRALKLPFVFSALPSDATLQAAGIVASWFGGLAGYRGYDFPVLTGNLPADQHAVVFQLGGQGLATAGLPVVTGPRLSIVNNPSGAGKKLLLIEGRDEAELRQAAMALTLATASLNGAVSTVAQQVQPPARKPYDAPAWVSTRGPVKLGDLVGPMDLQVEGQYPDLIRVPLRMPPDLYMKRGEGIPVDLGFRYSPRSGDDNSSLNVSFNSNFIDALPLNPSAKDAPLIDKLRHAVGLQKAYEAKRSVTVPREMFAPNGQLELYFDFDVLKDGECKNFPRQNLKASIDLDSKVDLSAFPHFMHMPDLAAFANAGFPHSRMADLSETAVVLPNTAGAGDMANFLRLMGRLGEQTGLPAYNATVVRWAGLSAIDDKDVILLGGTDWAALPQAWRDAMPLQANQDTWAVPVGGGFLGLADRWRPWLGQAKQAPQTVITLRQNNPEGLLMGFEKPGQSERSVVAMLGSEQGVSRLIDAMLSPEEVPAIRGSVVYAKASLVEQVLDAKTYTVGSLPLLALLHYYLSGSVFLNLLVLVLAALLFAFLMSRLLTRRAKARLEKK